MKLIKKLVNIGDSKAIIIPHQYLQYFELQGKKISKVRLQIGENILMEPIFDVLTPPISEEKSEL